ncbi:MAG: DEAD/DEAH box helicase [Bdellovibrionales bacterium]|nr:DEAD/DEAH box helicase [Bdellovibrionales bacterium]
MPPPAPPEVEERYQSNPFAVPEHELKLLNLDIIFRLARNGEGLRAHLPPRSKARRLLRAQAKVAYLRSERAFTFPVEALNEFLKQLRAKQCRFAVEAEAGDRLRSTATIRSAIEQEGHACSAEELRLALLVPYLVMVKGASKPRFAVCHATADELRELLPEPKPMKEKRTLAQSFSEKQLLRVLFRCRVEGLRLWLPAEVQSYLTLRSAAYQERLKTFPRGFEDELLGVIAPSLAAVCLPDGRAAIVLGQQGRASFAEQLRHVKTLRRPLELPTFRGAAAYAFEDYQIESVLEALKRAGPLTGSVPMGAEFLKRRALVAEHSALLQRQMSYQSMEDAEVPELCSELRSALFPHQRVAVRWLLDSPYGMLGDDMGLGKTLSVLATYQTLRERGEVDTLLVVCPNSLTRNWQREAERWIPDLKLAVMPETRAARIKLLKKLARYTADWVGGLVVNYESFRLSYVLEALLPLVSERRTLLVVDESQRTKNPKSKTFAALAELAPLCPRRVLLSGTPTPKDISDIWSQVVLLDQGERLGTNYYEWLGTVAELGNRWSEFAIVKYKQEAVENTVRRVQELLLRRRKEEVLDLPEKVFSIRDVPLSGTQKSRYEEIRKDLLLQVTATNGETYYREIDNILEAFLRAVQAASNPRLIDPAWEGEPAKFVELDEIVRELVGEQERKLVIWTNFRINVAELVERYAEFDAQPFTGDQSRAERAALVECFQQEPKRAKVLIAIPAAGGVGITLTAAQTAVYLDKTWNGEHWMQSVDRLHRIGQRGTVHVLSLHACRVDDLISANLRRKEAEQARLLGDVSGSTGEAVLPTRSELLQALRSIGSDAGQA